MLENPGHGADLPWPVDAVAHEEGLHKARRSQVRLCGEAPQRGCSPQPAGPVATGMRAECLDREPLSNVRMRATATRLGGSNRVCTTWLERTVE